MDEENCHDSADAVSKICLLDTSAPREAFEEISRFHSHSFQEFGVFLVFAEKLVRLNQTLGW
jgi:hypothetical protein